MDKADSKVSPEKTTGIQAAETILTEVKSKNSDALVLFVRMTS